MFNYLLPYKNQTISKIIGAVNDQHQTAVRMQTYLLPDKNCATSKIIDAFDDQHRTAVRMKKYIFYK